MARQIALAALTLALASSAGTFAQAQNTFPSSIILYRGQSFSGQQRTFTDAEMNLRWQNWNNVSSAWVRTGTWRLCRNPNLGGACVTLATGRYPRLSSWGLNNGVGSMTPIGRPR